MTNSNCGRFPCKKQHIHLFFSLDCRQFCNDVQEAVQRIEIPSRAGRLRQRNSASPDGRLSAASAEHTLSVIGNWQRDITHLQVNAHLLVSRTSQLYCIFLSFQGSIRLSTALPHQIQLSASNSGRDVSHFRQGRGKGAKLERKGALCQGREAAF